MQYFSVQKLIPCPSTDYLLELIFDPTLLYPDSPFSTNLASPLFCLTPNCLQFLRGKTRSYSLLGTNTPNNTLCVGHCPLQFKAMHCTVLNCTVLYIVA